MNFTALPARYLDQPELAELVENLAGRPDLWSDQVIWAGGTTPPSIATST